MNMLKQMIKFFYFSFIYGVLIVAGLLVAATLGTLAIAWLGWPVLLLPYSPWYGLLFIFSFGSFMYITTNEWNF